MQYLRGILGQYNYDVRACATGKVIWNVFMS